MGKVIQDGRVYYLDLLSLGGSPGVEEAFLYREWFMSPLKVLRYVEYGRRPLEALKQVEIRRGDRMLDLGCDWGYLAMLGASLGAEAHGIDICDRSIEFGMELAKKNGYSIKLGYANATAIPYPEGYFDYIFSIEAFEHFFPAERPLIMSEISRCLKPGGKLVVTTPNRFGLAEIVKQLLGKVSLARKLIPMLPSEPGEDGFVPPGTSRGDRMTNKPLSKGEMAALVKSAGMTLESSRDFVFVPEITPNALMPLARLLEAVLEKILLIRRLATTTLYVVSK